MSWHIGPIELQRVPYFDTPLPADSIGLAGVSDGLTWAGPWLADGEPAVGQAFWLVRVDGVTIVVDPCGASDVFLRTGPEALEHQRAAFDLLRASGCDPADVDHVVLTHLDGIGMVALTDGAGSWSPAFPNADLVVSRAEYDLIAAHGDEVPGGGAFSQLDAAGVVVTVEPPHELAPGVTLRHTGGHGPGHCRVDLESADERAVMIGHLAISPLHAAVGVSPDNHIDPDEAWHALRAVLDDAHHGRTLVTGSLWPGPGAARVESVDPYVLVPVD